MEKISGSALFTDMYELTMAASFFENRMFEPATFSLFIRDYPVELSPRLKDLQSRVVRQLKMPSKGKTGKN
jgi:nicotinic acid phosphoribosyltransferase